MAPTHFPSLCLIFFHSKHFPLFSRQDYLGGCIVFAAILTALATASYNCSNYTRRATQSVGTYVINKGADVDVDAEELTPTPSLVGLAINYTLLVPIYLNWVVKLFADMEMYAGSVERIAGYTQQQEEELEQEHEQEQKLEQEPEDLQQQVETRNEVDRSLDVDKVYTSATSAVTALALPEDSAKLNESQAMMAEMAQQVHRLSLTTIKDARRQRQLAAAAADKGALIDMPTRRRKICEYSKLLIHIHRFPGHYSQLIYDNPVINLANSIFFLVYLFA